MTMVIRVEEFTTETSTVPPYITAENRELIAEFNPISWSAHRGQDETGNWTFTIPYTAQFAEIFIDPTRSLTAYFMHDGVEQIHGLINDVKLSVSNDKLAYTVTGLGEVGALSRFVSKNYAYYEETPLLAIFYDLLDWAGWALGDHLTMPNIEEATTIDLRDQKNVLAQVRRVIESIPGLHWRYGGKNAGGREMLDIGFFDTLTDFQLQQATAVSVNPTMDTIVGQIKTIKFTDSRENLISEVQGNGGTYALDTSTDRQRVLDMWAVNELFTASPALEDPNYPLILDGDGFYRVRNLALHPTGGSSRETWDYIVTKNSIPITTAQRDSAAYALYTKCIRFLEENSTIIRTYTVNAVGLKNAPLPGDRLHVDANYFTVGTVFNNVRVPGLEIHTDLRIGAWDLKGSQDKVTSTFTLTSTEFMGEGVDPMGRDDVTQLVKGLAEQPYNRIGGAITEDYGNPLQTFVTTAHPTGSLGNCVSTDSLNVGTQITIPIGVIPPPEDPLIPITTVRVIGFLPTQPGQDENFTVNIIQQPDIVGTPLIVCFNWVRDWKQVYDSVSMETHFRFY